MHLDYWKGGVIILESLLITLKILSQVKRVQTSTSIKQ